MTRNMSGQNGAYANNQLNRQPNYYVPPLSSYDQQNGAAGPYTISGVRQSRSETKAKVSQVFHHFVCCFRGPNSQFDNSHCKNSVTLPHTPKRRRKPHLKIAIARPLSIFHWHSNGSTAHTPTSRMVSSQKRPMFASHWFQRPRKANSAVFRPSRISRAQPSPILGVQLQKPLLPPPQYPDAGKNCLIVDLDETLVHSSFTPVENSDFVVPVKVDGVMHNVYVTKRPFVDEFLRRIGEWFECVLFTASLAKYADPVASLLDRKGVFRSRLFREACVPRKGSYIKDLNRLGRDLKRVIILDNSPASYAYHPDNAIPVQSWFDDSRDTELIDLLPFLDKLSREDNVYNMLKRCKEPADAKNYRKNGLKR